MLTRVKETSFSPSVEKSNDMRGIEECRRIRDEGDETSVCVTQ